MKIYNKEKQQLLAQSAFNRRLIRIRDEAINNLPEIMRLFFLLARQKFST